MYTKDKRPGLITHTSNIVVPQVESTSGDGWKVVHSRGALCKFNHDFPKYSSPEANLHEGKSTSSETSQSSSVSITSTICRFSWANIFKSIDKAPLPKSIIILEEEINKEIEEDDENRSLENNQELSLINFESSNEYVLVLSDIISPKTIHLNDEINQSNEHDFLYYFDDTGSYNSEQQSVSAVLQVRLEYDYNKEWLKNQLNNRQTYSLLSWSNYETYFDKKYFYLILMSILPRRNIILVSASQLIQSYGEALKNLILPYW